MTLSAFAAVLRPQAAALLLPGARRCRSISFARTALSSKPAARRCCVRLMDGRKPDRFIDPAPHTICAQCQKASQIVKSPMLSLTEFSAKIVSTLHRRRSPGAGWGTGPNDGVGGTMQSGPPTLTPVDRNNHTVFGKINSLLLINTRNKVCYGRSVLPLQVRVGRRPAVLA